MAEDARMERLMDLHERALALPPAARPSFLQREAGHDPALLQEVESLLLAGESAPQFFDDLGRSLVAPAYEAIVGGPILQQITEALEGSYRVIEELGGGMSRVFLAEEVRLGRHVVIKVLPPGTAVGARADLFRREIQLAARLQHAHIVPVLTSDSSAGFLYYTMPYVAGESLGARIARDGALPVAEAVAIWRDVLEALAHAHASGVIHRDIKPSNILLAARSALVTDFGIAHAIEAAGSPAADTMGGVTVGTPVYMAPEQLRGAPDGDARMDIYAAGLVMYEMLMGRRPFDGETTREVVAARLEGEPHPLDRTDCPPQLAELVMRCLRVAVEERPVSADAVLEALEGDRNAGRGVANWRWARFAVVGALATVVALGLVLRQAAPPGVGAARNPTTRSLEAWEWYQRGMDLSLLRTRAGVEEGIGYFQRAIAADSTFAEAWAELSGMYLNLAGAEPGDQPALVARADSAARRAVALNGASAQAHAAMGWILGAQRNHRPARAAFERALALDPRTPRAYEGLAREYLWTGPASAQLLAATRGVDVDPFSHSAMRELALALAMNGRCAEAIERLLPLKSLNPPAGVAGVIRGQCFGVLGRWDDAIEEFRWAMRVSTARTALAFLGHALARAGHRDSARAILDDLLTGRKYSHGAFGIASVYAGLGDYERAFTWLDSSVTDGTTRLYLMGPMFDDLRRDPRFADVRRRLRLD